MRFEVKIDYDEEGEVVEIRMEKDGEKIFSTKLDFPLFESRFDDIFYLIGQLIENVIKLRKYETS